MCPSRESFNLGTHTLIHQKCSRILKSPFDQVPQLLHKLLLLLTFLLGNKFWQILAVLFGHLLAHLLGNLQEEVDYPMLIIISIPYVTCVHFL